MQLALMFAIKKLQFLLNNSIIYMKARIAAKFQSICRCNQHWCAIEIPIAES